MNAETSQIKLIAFDQDDTALLPDGKPSSEGLSAIEAALDHGLIVGSVSGRNIDRSTEPFRDARYLTRRPDCPAKSVRRCLSSRRRTASLHIAGFISCLSPLGLKQEPEESG